MLMFALVVRIAKGSISSWGLTNPCLHVGTSPGKFILILSANFMKNCLEVNLVYSLDPRYP
uniref:Uncharacterized protein n=1 Tax=Rhizophora mucronata TaxID=61149 RepID=A0A2P2PS85_RHIMU